MTLAQRNGIDLMAHLMRRAGFGASRSELEQLSAIGYENVVDQLLHPEEQPELDKFEFYRYFPQAESSWTYLHVQMDWLHTMRNGKRPLEEKMALFWHHVFATAASKVGHSYVLAAQVSLFQRLGMGNYREFLLELGKDPAMIFWLDNQENQKRAPNENWGRELLELFSMGVGNYTEGDVYEGSRAFTGWSFRSNESSWRWGQFGWSFEYRPEDHDVKEKSFLGHTGRFNGEDVAEIVVQQPACARFIARHLYSFFVADEPPVPRWSIEAPRDPAAVDMLAEKLISSGYEMKPVLHALFSSDFFKQAMFQRVKNPAEVVVGTLKLTGDLDGSTDLRWKKIPLECTYMGQDLLNPPSVEGWHTGREWINSGALVRRVNFVADYVRDTSLPGIQDIVRRITSDGRAISVEALVDRCLELMGPVEVSEETRASLIKKAGGDAEVSWEADDQRVDVSRRIGEILALIAGTREYQFA